LNRTRHHLSLTFPCIAQRPFYAAIADSRCTLRADRGIFRACRPTKKLPSGTAWRSSLRKAGTLSATRLRGSWRFTSCAGRRVQWPTRTAAELETREVDQRRPVRSRRELPSLQVRWRLSQGTAEGVAATGEAPARDKVVCPRIMRLFSKLS